MSGRLRFQLSVDGLARTRLVYSPLWETVFSLRTLADPGDGGVHAPWARSARSRLDGIDAETLLALWTPTALVPDFLTPTPTPGRPSLADELERIRRTPARQVRQELALTYQDSLPPGLEQLARRPSRGLDRLVHLLSAYWERTLATHWPRLRLVLEGDVVHRTRRLAAGGAVALFEELHERVSWESGEVVVCSRLAPRDVRVDVNDRGLLLLPSVFVWPHVATMFRAPWPPAMVYPSRGLALLWEAAETQGPQALGALIGRTRAGLLAALDGPCSTSELAQRVGLSVGGVSRHLAVLREAGLVASHRRGHAIVHATTPLGESLLRADLGDAPASASA